MKLLYVPEKLTNLIRFGLPTTFLEIERARGAGMFVNVMTAADSVQPIAKGFDDLAKICKSYVVRVGQQLLINLSRTHAH